MKRILEKIYLEKDNVVNISIFVGASVAMIVYVLIEDYYISFVSFFICFSLIKVLSKNVLDKINKKMVINEKMLSFSNSEKSVINSFIERGSCFLSLNDYRSGDIDLEDSGMDSLISRNLIEFIEKPLGDGPTGFHLNQDIYIFFKKYKLK